MARWLRELHAHCVRAGNVDNGAVDDDFGGSIFGIGGGTLSWNGVLVRSPVVE